MSTHFQDFGSFALIQSGTCLGCLLFAIITCRDRSTTNIPCRFVIGQHSRIILFCIICGILSVFLCSVNMAIFYWGWSPMQPPTIQSMIPYLMVKLGWNFGQFFSYLVFLFKLIDTFSNFTYRISRSFVICVVILLILYEMAWIIKSVAPLLFWLDFVHPHAHFFHTDLAQLLYYLTLPILILDIGITVLLIYMFSSRLLMVMRTHTNTLGDRNLQMIALHQSLTVGQTNHKLMNLVVKYTVLSTISALSSLIYVSLDAVTIFFDSDISLTLFLTLYFQLDTIITVVCLTLLIERADRIYRTLCCCCINVAHRNLRRLLMHPGSLNVSGSESSRSGISSH